MKENQLKFSQNEVFNFYKYYNAGNSIKDTAKHFDVSYRDVLHYLILFGYYTPRRKQSNVANLCENPHFFHKIDTSIKAYFLGLLMSDGYIMRTLYNKEIGIALKEEDKYILDKLNSLISPSKKVSKYKNSYKWKVISQQMYEDLVSYGFVENKSHNDYHYPNIPKEYDADFIRGYFDGDGSISIKSTGFNVISFSSNSKLFLEELAAKLASYNIKTRPIYSTIKNRLCAYHTLYISGRDNKRVFKRFLYNGATIFLNRKYERFKEIPC